MKQRGPGVKKGRNHGIERFDCHGLCLFILEHYHTLLCTFFSWEKSVRFVACGSCVGFLVARKSGWCDGDGG